MNYNQSPWKEVAWNGIRFLAPAAWQVGTLGKSYMILEEGSCPVLELKWGIIKGEFSHKVHLDRLATLHRKEFERAVRECPLPTGWKKALSAFETTGFSWRGKAMAGKGAILYCPTCQNATLIQFYHRDSRRIHKASQRLLTSFRDHRQDDQVVWNVFNIRAIIPDTFNLMKHRFETGEFELVFASREQKITLQRWGPASFLLRNRDLAQHASTIAKQPGRDLQSIVVAGQKAVELRTAPPIYRWFHWRSWVTSKLPSQWFRLWHVEEKNCLLGVCVEGKGSIDRHFFERICAGYESV
jgi:hypothetical protein